MDISSKKRESGILLPLFSLPSPYGIGTMGKHAYKFVDFLKSSGQTYWQMLPMGPTSFGDSPYQSFSTFAGNPYFIDLDMLVKEKLISSKDLPSDFPSDDIDYQELFNNRLPILRKAFSKGYARDRTDILAFRKENADWIEDYALFMSLKYHFKQMPWQLWPEPLKRRQPKELDDARKKYASDIEFWVYIQYLFYKQWGKLKAYASDSGVKIIGDIPIYVACDSSDAWSNPMLFQFDEQLQPTQVAGCPPDAFTEDGQLWGNPLYNWEYHASTNFDWWVSRLQATKLLFDRVRLDHFRGLEAYYCIPYGDKNARLGHWEKGPGREFIDTIKKRVPEIDLIAEDLGVMTPELTELLKYSELPGMKVIQFAFNADENSDYLPHMYEKNCVVYTGTHDNDTAKGWFESLSKKDRRFCREYLRLSRKEGYNWGIIRAAWSSVADLSIAQMQDFLDLDSNTRINFPSTIGTNWRWRLLEGQLTDQLAENILKITQIYRRLPVIPSVNNDL